MKDIINIMWSDKVQNKNNSSISDINQKGIHVNNQVNITFYTIYSISKSTNTKLT
jgi:hypothetical protein